MNQNILYVGLDVDGAHYDGSVFNKNRGNCFLYDAEL